MEPKHLLADKQWVINHYVEQNKSTYVIAEELGVTQVRVYRAVKKHGLSKTRSQAQTAALKTGRHPHPTKGKERSRAEKIAISAGREEYFKNLSDEEREVVTEKMRETANNYWKDKTPEERAAILKENRRKIQKAAKKGSKLEWTVWNAIRNAGFEQAQMHAVGKIPNTKLELDIWVPDLKVAIEIDGPTHFKPIYGAERLKKVQDADREKTGLILGNGCVMIRVKCIKEKPTMNQQASVCDDIVAILGAVQEKFPPAKNRLIELEINE